MASPEADSRLKQILTPSLDKIINNGSWRNSKLVHECKSILEKLQNGSISPNPDSPDSEQSVPGPLLDLSLPDSELLLSPFINACRSGNIKVAEPGLDCVQKLVAHGYIRGEADATGSAPEGKLLSRLIEFICKCAEIGDEGLELLVLRTLLSTVTSMSLRIHGDWLLLIVRTCYDIYLGRKNVVNQTTTKASLTQMLVIVFRRMEADSSTVPVQPIVAMEE